MSYVSSQQARYRCGETKALASWCGADEPAVIGKRVAAQGNQRICTGLVNAEGGG